MANPEPTKIPMSKHQEPTKILMSKQEILDYLKISNVCYRKFIRMGLPVLYLDGRCYAHRDNLDDFFKAITRVNMKNAPDEIIDGVME